MIWNAPVAGETSNQRGNAVLSARTITDRRTALTIGTGRRALSVEATRWLGQQKITALAWSQCRQALSMFPIRKFIVSAANWALRMGLHQFAVWNVADVFALLVCRSKFGEDRLTECGPFCFEG
jgi:hypothetical protein